MLSAPERVCRAGRIGLDPQRAEKKILYNGIERLFWIILDFYFFSFLDWKIENDTLRLIGWEIGKILKYVCKIQKIYELRI